MKAGQNLTRKGRLTYARCAEYLAFTQNEQRLSTLMIFYAAGVLPAACMRRPSRKESKAAGGGVVGDGG